jgi:hypothetical protein
MYKDKEFQEKVLKIYTLLHTKQVAEIFNKNKSKKYLFIQQSEILTVLIGKSRHVLPEKLYI